jgi:UDP-galactopyranose mutase
MSKSFLVVGAGFSGAVLSRELAEKLDCHVDVIDARPHVAGNCHTARDEATGVMVHEYGPHIFNTNHEDVWAYINRFTSFGPFVNRVKAVTGRGVFGLPINLLTINQFFGKTFSPEEARDFVEGLGDKSITDPKTFEEQALRFLGRDLYEGFFYGYTKKQWGCEPSELPASILKRLPVRFNYDDNYYSTRYQGIPLDGYTAIVAKILDCPRVRVTLKTAFAPDMIGQYDHVFYTGPIDAFFGHELGRLRYRTVEFERFEAEGDIQGNAVINYTQESVPFTRIHEHKHFAPWESHKGSVAFREFSKATGPEDVPYYPLRLSPDRDLFSVYEALAGNLPNVSFLGRLATYRYLDMDQVIGEALDIAQAALTNLKEGSRPPIFGPQRSKATA